MTDSRLLIDRVLLGAVCSCVERTLPAAETRPISDPSQEPVLLELIRLISARPRVSQRNIASALGVSVGKVNYCIRALIEKGLVKTENYRNSNNKLSYAYLLTPSGIAAKAEMTRLFLAEKVAEYDALRTQIEQIQRESEQAARGE